jgi:hypothetical protein
LGFQVNFLFVPPKKLNAYRFLPGCLPYSARKVHHSGDSSRTSNI